MRTRTKTVIAALSVTALAVVGMDAATYAGTGDSLLLGKFNNKTNRTTHIHNTGNGPALSLHARGNRPALAVDSNRKINRLNADRVDGKHAAGLQNNVRIFTTSSSGSASGHVFELSDFPNGRYQATYDVYMSGASGTPAAPEYGYCYFQRQGTTAAYSGYTSTTSTGAVIGVSGSDILNKNSADWHLICGSSDPWSVSSTLPVRITLTKVDKTIGGALTTTRTQARAGLLGR